MTMEMLWDNEEPISNLGIDVPGWIDSDFSPSDLAAVLQGGCDSGAYMPAVTYRDALATIAEHGASIFDYLEESGIDASSLAHGCASWAGMACAIVSAAVESWCSEVEDEVSMALEEVSE